MVNAKTCLPSAEGFSADEIYHDVDVIYCNTFVDTFAVLGHARLNIWHRSLVLCQFQYRGTQAAHSSTDINHMTVVGGSCD